MANTRGIFTLKYIVEEKIPLDDWVDLDNVWIGPSPFLGPSPNTGYFGGGTPAPSNIMDKVTYASDTTAAVPGAALSVARQGVAASSARANALPTATPGPVIV